jgi:hypothetical protein
MRQPPEPNTSRALRRRLIWLSWFFAEPIIDPRETRARRLAAAGVIAAVIAVGGMIVARSIEYHAIYTERIEAQEREITKQHEQRKQKELTPHGEAEAH